jgi:hypothetical protein
MAFAIDHPIRRRQGPAQNVVLPKYDVKIVAGKRIVIFHQEEPKPESPKIEEIKLEPEPEPESEPEPEPEVIIPDKSKSVYRNLATPLKSNEKPKSSR